jgi:50S ribosomal protein L16 3-hydroxylase
MLYLPPGWAHDGVAKGECLTASIGFRSASREEIVHQVLQRWLDADDAAEGATRLYRDPSQTAAANPARIPQRLQAYAAQAVARAMADPTALACGLGEWLSEPAAGVAFDSAQDAPGQQTDDASGWRLDRRTRMLYDDRHVFINGESFRAAGRDAIAMRRFADDRRLAPALQRALSADARALLADWADAGWIHRVTAGDDRSGEDGGS